MAMRGIEENAGTSLQDLYAQQDHGRDESQMDLDTGSDHDHGGASSQGSPHQRHERVDDKVLDPPTGESKQCH
jgi:hypothetical protein